MRKLFILLLKFFVPILAVLITYAWLDPFKVIWHYDSFYDANNTISVPLDKDYVSTANYDNHYRNEHYDSFIFGNSRSIFYETGTWSRYISIGSKPYHFDASSETLYGISKKIEYISGKGEKINNALLIVDDVLLSGGKPLDGHLFAVSPQLEGYATLPDFHLQFLRTFLSYKFLPGYIEHTITGQVKPYMKKAALTEEPFLYNKQTNEMRHTTAESEIASGTFYTAEKMKVFYKRKTSQHYSKAVIGKSQQQMLREIAQIFKKQGTKYKIVINPLYDQVKLNKEDLAYLQRLFGNENVHDFSGINIITKDYTNYYESSHYRPHVATAIMAEIYNK